MDLFRMIKEKRNQCFISFSIVFFIHFLKFTNYYPNWDSVRFVKTDWTGQTGLGRWFAGFTHRLLHSPYDLQWIEGIISSIFIALSIMLILEIFEIRKLLYIYIATFLFAAFPSMAATFCYMFWAPSYMLALFMSVLATFLCIKQECNKKTIIISTVLLTFSLGIYQIYYTVAFIIFLYFLANQLLDPSKKIKDYKQPILAFTISAILGFVFNYFIMKIILALHQIELSEYQGISHSGMMSLSDYIHSIQKMFFSFNYFFFDGLQIKSLINITCVTVLCLGAIYFLISKKIKTNVKILTFLFFVLFFAVINALEFLFPDVNFFRNIDYFFFKYIVLAFKTAPYVFINIIFSLLLIYMLGKIIARDNSLKIQRKILIISLFFTSIPLTYSMHLISSGVSYHRLMELGIFFIYFIVFLLFEHKASYFTKTTKAYSVLLLIILCFYHFINNNIAYKQIEMSYKRTSFETMQILGEIDRINYGNKNCLAIVGKIPGERDLIIAKPNITGASTNNFLPTDYHFLRFSEYYFGREFSACSDEQKNELKNRTDFIEMPEYPKAGFAKIIDDMIVVKLHNN